MTGVHERMATQDHEKLRFFSTASEDVRMFVAIHDTTLGPTAGCTQRYAFESEDQAHNECSDTRGR